MEGRRPRFVPCRARASVFAAPPGATTARGSFSARTAEECLSTPFPPRAGRQKRSWPEGNDNLTMPQFLPRGFTLARRGFQYGLSRGL